MPKYFLFLAFLISCSGISQNAIAIKGKICDSKSQLPLEAATVYLSSTADSTVIDYTITDKKGAFLMNTRKITKPFFLKVSYVGYQTYKQQLSFLSDNIDFGVLRLIENSNTLGEVVVKSEVPPIRIKKDTLEFNASSFKVRPDSNVQTLLKQLPGVEISEDGKITVNGKEVNQVLVNGQPFFDKDGKIALQSLPSEIINKVQITDTKTKKEELTKSAASSNNASINLTIDEEKNKGLFGKFMGGYGTDDRYESSALVNYFKKKRKISLLASSNNINATGFSMDEVFDNMGGGRNENVYINNDGSYGIGNLRFGGGKGIIRSNMIGLNYADQWLKNFDTSGNYFFTNATGENQNRTKWVKLLPAGNQATISNNTTSEESFGHNLNFNFEYKVDSTATFVMTTKFSAANTKNKGVSSESTADASNQLLNENASQVSDNSDKTNFSNTINFNKTFVRKGRYVNVMFENINANEDLRGLNKSDTRFYQNSDPDDVRDQIRKNRNNKDSYATEIEFAEPIKDSLNLRLGVYARWEKVSEDQKTYDFETVSDSYTAVNNPQTNFFSSTMKLITPKSGFTIQKSKFNFDFSVGTTISQMDNYSRYLGTSTVLNRTYIFPYVTTYGSYRFNKSKSVRINYEYIAGFPDALQLLPIENLADPLNTIVGNADLKIDDGHRLYLGYNDYDYAKRAGYTVYAGGSYYNTQRVTATLFDSSGKRTTSYDNVSGTYETYGGFHWNKSIKKEAHTFRIMMGLNSALSKSKGFTNSKLFEANSLELRPRINFNYDYGELLTINPSYSLTYNESKYTNYTVRSASNVLHKFNIQTTNYWPKNWVFGNDFGYSYNSNIVDGFKKDFYLWNSSLAYSFFNKKFTAKVKVYDVLNQNQSATRTITPNAIRDEENVVLKRYAMFSLTYKIERFAGKEKPSENRFMMY